MTTNYKTATYLDTFWGDRIVYKNILNKFINYYGFSMELGRIFPDKPQKLKVRKGHGGPRYASLPVKLCVKLARDGHPLMCHNILPLFMVCATIICSGRPIYNYIK
jgi:hypothetical protein